MYTKEGERQALPPKFNRSALATGRMRMFLFVVFPIESKVSAPGACLYDEANVIVSQARTAYALIVLGRLRGDLQAGHDVFRGDVPRPRGAAGLVKVERKVSQLAREELRHAEGVAAA